MVGKRHPGKADQLTLANGGNGHSVINELFRLVYVHLYIVISWGNKINFGLCVNCHVKSGLPFVVSPVQIYQIISTPRITYFNFAELFGPLNKYF